jgi:hypothetical protein
LSFRNAKSDIFSSVGITGNTTFVIKLVK